MRSIGGVHYVNTGDWVESCTALVEHQDGRLEIIRWTRALAVEADEDMREPSAAVAA